MTSAVGYDSRGRVEKLFATVDSAGDPEGLVTRYMEYELHRLKQKNINPGGSLAERHRLLKWYYSWYALMRHDDEIHVPMSSGQVRFLNSVMPIADGSNAITVALFNSVMESIPSHLNMLDHNVLCSAVYWWCIEKTPVLRLDDRLVTLDQVNLLRSECQWHGSPCPLTIFMREYFNRHTELHYLEMSDPRDRVALLHYLLLLSFSRPEIARYLPQQAVHAALKPMNGSDAASSFERVLARHALTTRDEKSARSLIAQGEQTLERAGFSFRKGWIQKRFCNGNSGDCFVNARASVDPPEDGVAVIGPIYSTSGLGQATRLSLSALITAERTPPTVLPFKLDNPAPIGFATDIAFTPYSERRAINLIHLNAESVPLAFAYMDKNIFEQSYNIGFFFWELDKIPKCHELALDLLDEIWVSSEYNREIYAKRAAIPVTNVGMAVEATPVVEAMDRNTLGISPSSFVFLTTFDSFSFIERKNPLGVVEAFKAAFPDPATDVYLLLKTQNRTKVGDRYQIEMWKRIDEAIAIDHRIMVIDETYEYQKLISLKLACDCYVSLHRSEGWGFGMIEAMQLGRPVICTGYSGNMEFCNSQTAYLVDYDLITPVDEEYIFVPRGSVWADPKRESAVACMREVVTSRAKAAQKGRHAARVITTQFSVEAIGRRFASRLTDIRSTILANSRCDRPVTKGRSVSRDAVAAG